MPVVRITSRLTVQPCRQEEDGLHVQKRGFRKNHTQSLKSWDKRVGDWLHQGTPRGKRAGWDCPASVDGVQVPRRSATVPLQVSFLSFSFQAVLGVTPRSQTCQAGALVLSGLLSPPLSFGGNWIFRQLEFWIPKELSRNSATQVEDRGRGH